MTNLIRYNCDRYNRVRLYVNRVARYMTEMWRAPKKLVKFTRKLAMQSQLTLKKLATKYFHRVTLPRKQSFFLTWVFKLYFYIITTKSKAQLRHKDGLVCIELPHFVSCDIIKHYKMTIVFNKGLRLDRLVSVGPDFRYWSWSWSRY
jgi:hypothetical protein